MKLDRNDLAPGTEVRWINGGWVLGVIREKVVGAQKTMYLCDPPFGMKHFGGASHTTGWPCSLIGADCLIDFGPGSKDTMTAPNLEYAYNESLKYFKGELIAVPPYHPQDRNMYQVWREQKNGDKVAPAADTAVAEEVKPVARVRERQKPAPVILDAVAVAPRVRTRVRA